ncbi:MAG TPA: CDP-glycerol glycerophosphotransferase family protein [Candidatus Limnocylindrales bacterium]|nr:CDP-glycerol glycerophosphotransferase family protein [Candidatus Limnocylindrales bacterium]
MQGPDAVPLPPGRWDVVLADGSRGVRPLIVADPGPIATPSSRAQFPVGKRGTYVAQPAVDGRGRLALEVRLDPPSDRVPGSPDEPAEDAGLDGDDGGADVDAGGEVVAAAHRTASRASLAGDRARRLLWALAGPPIGWARPRAFQLAFNLFRIAAVRNGRRILFTSDSRSELGGNLKLIHDRMVERGIDRRYELMTLFKPGIRARRTWRDRFRLPWLLARADVVVVDDYQPVIYRVQDRDVKIVQVWHAYGSFKTVGYSRVGKPGGPSPWSRVHKNYTYATVGSHNDVPHYAEAFGIPERRVVPTGVPRMDEFVAASRDPGRRGAVYDAVPEAVGRWTILFAPTFRGSGARTATYDTSLLDLAALHDLCVEKNAVFVIRLHPFVADRFAIPPDLADRIVDATDRPVETNDLLLATDLLITDYSSIVFEYSTLRRPVLLFAHDLDEYVSARDFYVPYEEWVPGRIVRSFPELVDAIRREDFGSERLDRFVERSFDHLEGGAADRIIDQLILNG